MTKTIALLITLDTKYQEADYLIERIEKRGHHVLLIDIGVVGEPGTQASISREKVAEAGGSSLQDLLKNPTREEAGPVMVKGSINILLDRIATDEVHAVLGLGGTQGTSSCCNIMQALPYGFPKIMVSTIASGDTSGFVGIKDITMMFSVSDILKLNPFTRKILANAAAAACGMAEVETKFSMEKGGKTLIGMSNLGVLTTGAMQAIQYIEEKGYEVIVFHAVGSGGKAMEQMMKEGIIGAVFDYAMGEIADDVWSVLRAGGPERLTVAGKLGIPQVLCPGGAEHLGILVPPNEVPEEYKDHDYVFHSPVVFVPRLNAEEIVRVAADICKRLQHTKGNAYFMIPRGGVGRYSKEGASLYDKESDDVFFSYLIAHLPDTIEVVDCEEYVEDSAFVKKGVDLLIGMIEKDH
ncbi:MAG: UPF0261 family protein [Bacteroidetes bacterium]|nr:MAG: UPF0261 family protein [Bacteroidota bacterium]